MKCQREWSISSGSTQFAKLKKQNNLEIPTGNPSKCIMDDPILVSTCMGESISIEKGQSVSRLAWVNSVTFVVC